MKLSGRFEVMSKFHCRLNPSCIILSLLMVLGRAMRYAGRTRDLIIQYHCRIGAAVSIVLITLNFYMYSNGCRYLELPSLPKGYAPLFPHHYFHLSSQDGKHIENPELLDNTDDLDSYFADNVIKNSIDSNVPPLVHIAWCEVGPFTYFHYLSVLSAFKILRPSVLTLHIVETPHRDADGYYQFLDDLKRDIPVFVVKQLESSEACHGSNHIKLQTFVDLIGPEGGIAISGKAVLVPGPLIGSNLLVREFSLGRNSRTKEPMIVFMQRNVFSRFSEVDALLALDNAKHFECLQYETFKITSETLCMSSNREIFPVETFYGSRPSQRLLRWIGYGTSKDFTPKKASSVIVPNIVHYVWLGKRKLKYFGYLSIMSAIHVLKADMVYVHGDIEPEGPLWKEVNRNKHVMFINRKFPSSVYGQPIVKYASHASDFLRGDLLLRYGGVYADWDVIFLRELSPELRSYNTTTNVDWPETGAFPDVFNLGVLVAAPGAPFLRHFLESYRWYLDGHWSYNAIHMPYKVYEKVPWSLNIDRHLQILCARQKCHATWLKDYKSSSANHLEEGKIEWTTDALAIHWTYPDPPAFENQEMLLKGKSHVARIGQNVLGKAFGKNLITSF